MAQVFLRLPNTRTCLIILFVLMLAVSGILSLKPISDFDFFWHIATGRWIAENGALPDADPFSYTTMTDSSRARFVLKAYWLAQLVYYGTYKIGGWNGIVLMRFFIMCAVLVFLCLAGKRNDRTIHLGLVLMGAMIIFQWYKMERPQVFSFLFFAVLIYLLREFARNERPSRIFYFIFPLTTLLWSNMHPGIIVGQAVIVTYLIAEALKFLHPGLYPLRKDAYRRLLLAGCAGLAASLINPNTYRPVIELFQMPEILRITVLEYRSTIEAFANYGATEMVIYWFFLLLALMVTLIKAVKKKPDLTEIGLLLGLGYFSFTQVRHIAFLVIWALPVISAYISGSLNRAGFMRAGVFLLSVLSIFIFMKGEWPYAQNVRAFRTGDWVDVSFPEPAARFVKESGIRGNMFNMYDWGGYLIWRMYPGSKVFIDGRQLDVDAYSMMEPIVSGTGQLMGAPYYRSVFNAFQVRYVLIPPAYVRGEMLPLSEKLMKDPDWAPVFYDMFSIVFVKRVPENAEVIKRREISRDALLAGLTLKYSGWLRGHPDDTPAYITMGDLFLAQNRLYEARRVYEAGLRTAPFNLILKDRLDMLSSATAY